MHNPKVSFVVLCYRTEQYVGHCIESILGQDLGCEWEVVAIDDCSPDGTYEVLQRYRDARIRVIRHDRNQGHGASITEALRAARGDLMARIDSDDRYRPGYLKSVLPIFGQYPEVGLVYGDTAIIDSQGKLCVERCDRWHGGADFKGNELVALLEENFICAPTIIARREAWLKHLPVPGHLSFHDWYFTVNIAREWEFYYVNKVLADYRVHGGNLHSKLVLQRSEEPSILWMLETVFKSRETSEELENRKQRARRRIYGRHYWILANKYFGCGMYRDARRCYLAALRYRPALLLSGELQRRVMGTVLGRENYEAAKQWFKNRFVTGSA